MHKALCNRRSVQIYATSDNLSRYVYDAIMCSINKQKIWPENNRTSLYLFLSLTHSFFLILSLYAHPFLSLTAA